MTKRKKYRKTLGEQAKLTDQISMAPVINTLTETSAFIKLAAGDLTPGQLRTLEETIEIARDYAKKKGVDVDQAESEAAMLVATIKGLGTQNRSLVVSWIALGISLIFNLIFLVLYLLSLAQARGS